MLLEAQRERLEVVLVSPRNPLNIGAAARAMANFGFRRLVVVAAFEAHWREAKSAVQAEDLLQTAKTHATLAEALEQSTLVVGTGSLTHRKPEQRIVALPELSPIVQQELARGGRVVLLFGSEKRGLTRDNLAACHLLVEIPTDPRQPSMNLGQAVAVCLYELAAGCDRSAASGNISADPAQLNDSSRASAGELELLAEVVEEAMLASNYSPSAMHLANRRDLQLLLRRLSLSRRDTRRVLGLFRRIVWRLRHGGAKIEP